MDAKTPQETPVTQPLAGVGESASTVVGNLDMADRKDRGILRKSVERRWPGLDSAMRGKAVECLKAAMELSMQKADHRAMLDSVKTMQALESQHQADDHIADKNNRLDNGLPTDGLTVVSIPSPVRPRMEGGGA